MLDSTFRRDSIYIHEYTRGDTVYLDRYLDRWRERIVTQTDTVYTEHEVILRSPPERYVPVVVKILAWIGGITIVLLVLWIVWKIL